MSGGCRVSPRFCIFVSANQENKAAGYVQDFLT